MGHWTEAGRRQHTSCDWTHCGRHAPHLVEAVLAAVRDINDRDDLGDEPGVKHVGQVELSLKVGRTGEDDALDVDLVVGDEVLDRVLGDLADVVVPGFHPESRETERRLSTTAVLLGQVNRELVQDLTRVAAERAEELV
jgi:hypothetical protein